MYGEPLCKNKVSVSTYRRMEGAKSIPKVRGGFHIYYIFSKG